MKPPSFAASAAARATTSSHRRKASASSGVALAVTISFTAFISSRIIFPASAALSGLKSFRGFCFSFIIEAMS